MKVTSKEQFDAIQYTSIEAIRDFLNEACPGTRIIERVGHIWIGTAYNELKKGDWLLIKNGIKILTDERFKERYISAEAFNDAVKYANGVNSLVFELDEKVDELHNKIEEMSFKEKDFIAQADLRSSERSENSARIKQQILDKL